MAIYTIWNGPVPTTAAQVPVATGTSIKTLLQVEPSATKPMKVLEWGISFDGSSAATPGKCELLETTVAATVTASAQADIIPVDGEALAAGNVTTNLIQVGTANTGYTASAEGSITTVRMFDAQLIAPTNQYSRAWMLGNEPVIQTGKFLRVRVTFGTTVNAYCYVTVQV